MVHIYLEKFDQEISIGEHAYQSSQVSLKVKVENTIKTIEELSDEQKTNLSESIRDEIYNILISEFASLIKNQIAIDYKIGSIVVVIDLNTSNLTNNVVNIINNNKTTIEDEIVALFVLYDLIEDEENTNITSVVSTNIFNPNNAVTENIILDNTTINENEAIGTPIGTISIQDENSDEEDITNFTLSLSGSDEDSFTIDGDKLKSNEIFNFEVKSSYSITIEATDGSRNLTQTFQITILNVNEGPTNIFLSNNTILEKRSIGTIVGYLSGEDIDSTSFTFTLSGIDADSFNIPNNTTTLISSKRFIYKQKNTYNITITISDDELTFSKDFVIRILNAPITKVPSGGGGGGGGAFYPPAPVIPVPKPPVENPIMPPREDVINAYIDVDIEKMKETFKFTKKTNNSILGNYTEIKYVIEPEYFLEELAKRISSAYTKYSDFNEKDINKIFQESEYNGENNTLTNDMIKHISQELFNNFHLTDLFKNYGELIHYLNDSLETMVSSVSNNIFKDTFTKGHEMTNSYSERYNENNIGHSIIKYMYDSEPLRLGNIYDYIKESYDNDDNVIDIVSIESDNLSLYYSPFELHDTLHFYLTINGDKDQKQLVNKEGQITRRYKIILVMKPSEYFKKEDEETENFENMETFANFEKMGFQEMMEMKNMEVELQKNIIIKTFDHKIQEKPEITTNKIAHDKIEQLYKIQKARKKQITKQNQLLIEKYLLKNNMEKTTSAKKRIIKRPQSTNSFEVALPMKEATSNSNKKRNYKSSQKKLVGITFYKTNQTEITDIRR